MPSTGRNRTTMNKRGAFDAAVVLEIDGERFFVADAGIAKMLLETRFPYKHGPSYKRALDACVAFAAGIGTTAAVRVTLVVAAMEAGFRFEVIEDREIG